MAEKKIGEIALVTMGQSPGGDTYNRERDGVPLLNGPTEFGPTSPQCTLFTTNSKRECVHGDLLFCVRGSTTGRMNWADQAYSLGRGVCAIRGKTTLATRYVRYCLEVSLPALLKLSSGGTFPNLRKDDIEGFSIPFHQHYEKIAAILSAYDDLIANNLRRIKILEEMAQSLYREWFIKFRFPGHQKVELVNSPLGKIPEGWDTTSIDELCEYISRGISPQYKEDIDCRVINQRCIRDNRLELELARGNTKQVPADKFVRFGDVLINSTGVGTLGRVAQIYRELKGHTVDSHVTIVRPVAGVNLDYFGLSMILLQHHFERLGTGATGQTELNRVSIAETKLIAPPFPIQKEFGEIASPLRSHAEILRLKNHTLRQTRDLLLPKLISGELDVSELDITIPEASA